VSVVVVVPAFAEGEDGDPEAVARIIGGVKAPRAPQMRCRIHEPGEVQPQGHAQEDGPQGDLPAEYRQDQQARYRQGYPVPFADPDMEAVVHQVAGVGSELFGGSVHGFAARDPAHVRPPFAVARRMRIARLVGMAMMDAVRPDPEDRSAFERHRGEDGEQVFHPFRCLVGPMGEQAVVAHPDAEAACDPPQNQRQDETLPAEGKERGDGADVERHEEEVSDPVDLFEPVDEFGGQACVPGWRLTRARP
jgi:hypothetical protein